MIFTDAYVRTGEVVHKAGHIHPGTRQGRQRLEIRGAYRVPTLLLPRPDAPVSAVTDHVQEAIHLRPRDLRTAHGHPCTRRTPTPLSTACLQPSWGRLHAEAGGHGLPHYPNIADAVSRAGTCREPDKSIGHAWMTTRTPPRRSSPERPPTSTAGPTRRWTPSRTPQTEPARYGGAEGAGRVRSAPCPVPPSFGAGRRITRVLRIYRKKTSPLCACARAHVLECIHARNSPWGVARQSRPLAVMRACTYRNIVGLGLTLYMRS